MFIHLHDAAAGTHLAVRANTGLKPYFSWPNLCVRTHVHMSSYTGVCA
jgi:hypothetical protein